MLLFGFMANAAIGGALIGLACWQGFLICTGQTSIEYCENQEQRDHLRTVGEVAIFLKRWHLLMNMIMEQRTI
jgi:hypothetical protein